MKKLLLIGMMGLLMAGVSHAFTSGYWLCEDDTLPRYPILCLKANGINAAVIESCNMFVYLGSARVYGTSARTNILDSVTYAGKKNYMLDTILVNEIDGTGGVGWYQVVINTFYTGGGDTSTTNSFDFFKIGATSAGQELITDIINDNFDAEVTAMGNDVMTAGALHGGAAKEVADSTAYWVAEEAQAEHLNAGTHMYLVNLAATNAKAAADSLNSIDGVLYQVDDNISTMQDSINALDNANELKADVQAIRDSINNHDNWIAAQAEVANIDGWNPVTDNDSLIADRSSAMLYAANFVANYYKIIGDTVSMDSLAYQGAASGLTAQGIWSYVLTPFLVADSEGTAGYDLALQDTANSWFYDVNSDSALFDSLRIPYTYKKGISNWSAVSAGADTAAILDMLVFEDFLQGADSVRIANWPWDNDNIARANRDVDDIASFDGANGVIVGSINNEVITTEAIKNGAMTPAKFDTSFYRVAADTLLRRTVTSPSGPIPPTSIATYIPNTNAYVNGDGVSGLDARVLEIQEDIGDPSNQDPATRVAWATDDSLGNLTISDTTGLGITIVIDTASFFAQMKAEGFTRKVGMSNDSIYAALNAGVTSTLLNAIYNSIGLDTVETANPTLGLSVGDTISLHDKIGDAYSGGEGSNVEDNLDSLNASLAAIAAGSGIDGYPVSVYVKSATRYLHGADVYLVPSGGGSRLHAKTNAAGLSSFMATTGTWYIYIYNTFCDQDAAYDSLIMTSAAITDTITLTCEEASLYNTTQIFGAVSDFDASQLKKVKVSAKLVSAQANVKITSTNTKISPFERTVAVDAYGHWQIPVFANSILSDTLSKYQITISGASGTIHKSLITVPDQGIYELP